MKERYISSRRTACIYCNGELRGDHEARAFASRANILIAADGGAEHMQALGLRPHAIIGDMDSLREDPWPDDKGIQRIRLSPDKDKCDGELAVEWALEHGCNKALLLAAWGGRMDQALGNCALLMRHPKTVAIWDDGILLVATNAGQELVLPVAAGTAVSIISFLPGTVIHTEGLAYRLSSEPLRSATHGISNTVTRTHPVVSVVEGAALVCMEGGDTWLNE